MRLSELRMIISTPRQGNNRLIISCFLLDKLIVRERLFIQGISLGHNVNATVFVGSLGSKTKAAVRFLIRGFPPMM
jgi:hypothetical protein